MSNVTNYLDRRADLSVIPIVPEPVGDVFPPVQFNNGDIVTGIAGIGQLAQWVALELYTEIGSSPYFDSGTHLLNDLRMSGASVLRATQAFNRAADLVKRRAVDQANLPEDEQLDDIILLDISFPAQDAVSFSVRVQSVAGEVVEFLAPLQYNIQDSM